MSEAPNRDQNTLQQLAAWRAFNNFNVHTGLHFFKSPCAEDHLPTSLHGQVTSGGLRHSRETCSQIQY
jgi:hypothetical protein